VKSAAVAALAGGKVENSQKSGTQLKKQQLRVASATTAAAATQTLSTN